MTPQELILVIKALAAEGTALAILLNLLLLIAKVLFDWIRHGWEEKRDEQAKLERDQLLNKALDVERRLIEHSATTLNNIEKVQMNLEHNTRVTEDTKKSTEEAKVLSAKAFNEANRVNDKLASLLKNSDDKLTAVMTGWLHRGVESPAQRVYNAEESRQEKTAEEVPRGTGISGGGGALPEDGDAGSGAS